MAATRSIHSLVVGGTRGLGRAVVRALAAEGHAVSVIGRRPPMEADEPRSGVRHWAVDLTDGQRLSDALAEIRAVNPPLRNLVCAQRYRGQGDAWEGELATSLTATKRLIEWLAEGAEETADKSVVIAGSIASHFVAGEQPLGYHVAKAGLEQMVRYYAVALGPKGIRVNSVSLPAFLKEESRAFYREHQELQDLYASIIPLGRMGTAEEIAKVIAFLCSPGAAFITGQRLVVDGGLSLQWQESLARQLTALNTVEVVRRSTGAGTP